MSRMVEGNCSSAIENSQTFLGHVIQRTDSRADFLRVACILALFKIFLRTFSTSNERGHEFVFSRFHQYNMVYMPGSLALNQNYNDKEGCKMSKVSSETPGAARSCRSESALPKIAPSILHWHSIPFHQGKSSTATAIRGAVAVG